jgi:hypothetical protein
MDLVEKATNELVKDLKSNNIWDKLKCVYPLIGSSKKEPKNTPIFNLKDIPKWRRIDKIKKIWQTNLIK